VKIVDADVLIDALRGRDAAVALLARHRHADVPLLASEITRFEVLAGLRVGEEEETERLLAEIEFVPVTEIISRMAAALVRAFRPAYSGIEDEDYIVAATTIELDGELLTRNSRHFPMMEGLEPAY
jgi:predicted nucleic acid-binding protein